MTLTLTGSHARCSTGGSGPGPAILSDPRSSLIQRGIDVDLFVVSLHRLHTVAQLAAEVTDPRNVLARALERFNGLTGGLPLSESQADQAATIASVRNAFEHGQNLAIRGGLGLASGPDGGGSATATVRSR
jgi:hypothetical protein